MAMLGDPGGAGEILLGDPGVGSIFRSIASRLPVVGGIFQRGLPALGPARGVGGPLGRAVGRATRVLSTPVGAGAAGAIVGAGIGSLGSTVLNGGGGPAGWITITDRRGRATKMIAPNGRVVNLRRRRRGISAAALSGAFRLARIAHAFGGVARTGRRPRRRVHA